MGSDTCPERYGLERCRACASSIYYMWLLAPVLEAGCVQGFRRFLNAGFNLVRLFGKRDRELFQGLPRETMVFS